MRARCTRCARIRCAINRAFGALAGWCFDHRWIVLAAVALFVAGGSWAARHVRVDNSYEAFFAPGDPSYREYLTYRDDFGSDEVSYLMYEAPAAADGVFDLEVMGRIAQLTKAIEDEVPFLYEVTSLANAELVTSTAEGIEIRRLWRDFPHTREAMQEARALFLAKPQYVGGLVTADGRFGAISIDMDRTSTDPLERIRLDPNGEPDGLDNLYPQATSEAIERDPRAAGVRGIDLPPLGRRPAEHRLQPDHRGRERDAPEDLDRGDRGGAGAVLPLRGRRARPARRSCSSR